MAGVRPPGVRKAAGFGDEVRAMVAGRRPMPPYDRHVGIRILSATKAGARLTVDADERFHNPARVLHGGILSGLVDSAMAYAVAPHLDPDQSVTNLDLTIRFLKATVRARLTAKARVVRAGRTIVVTECDVRSDDGQLVARASSTFVRLPAQGGPGWLAPGGRARPGTPGPARKGRPYSGRKTTSPRASLAPKT